MEKFLKTYKPGTQDGGHFDKMFEMYNEKGGNSWVPPIKDNKRGPAKPPNRQLQVSYEEGGDSSNLDSAPPPSTPEAGDSSEESQPAPPPPVIPTNPEPVTPTPTESAPAPPAAPVNSAPAAPSPSAAPAPSVDEKVTSPHYNPTPAEPNIKDKKFKQTMTKEEFSRWEESFQRLVGDDEMFMAIKNFDSIKRFVYKVLPKIRLFKSTIDEIGIVFKRERGEPDWVQPFMSVVIITLTCLILGFRVLSHIFEPKENYKRLPVSAKERNKKEPEHVSKSRVRYVSTNA